MTAAEDRREDLEAVVRRQLTNITKRPHTANECTDAILKAADAYTKAGHLNAPKPAEPPKPPAVHYAPRNGYAACRPYYTHSTRSWAVSADPQAVTCGSCRKTPAWRKVAEAA